MILHSFINQSLCQCRAGDVKHVFMFEALPSGPPGVRQNSLYLVELKFISVSWFPSILILDVDLLDINKSGINSSFF